MRMLQQEHLWMRNVEIHLPNSIFFVVIASRKNKQMFSYFFHVSFWLISLRSMSSFILGRRWIFSFDKSFAFAFVSRQFHFLLFESQLHYMLWSYESISWSPVCSFITRKILPKLRCHFVLLLFTIRQPFSLWMTIPLFSCAAKFRQKWKKRCIYSFVMNGNFH